MHIGELGLQILRLLSSNWKDRVVSLDIETHVKSKEDFLTDEYILSIALATRSSGNLTSSPGIEVEVLILEDENEEAELNLLLELNKWLGQCRPLSLIGYGLRAYDIPLLLKKNRKYREHLDRPLWKIIDALQQSVHIDLCAMLKTWFGV